MSEPLTSTEHAPHKLTAGEKHILTLISREADADGWAPVSKFVAPLFIDKRRETHTIDVGTPGTVGRSPIVVDPDQIADFTAMPFADESFHLVVFDPPHVQRQEARGIVTRKYGVLTGDWREMLRAGFVECFRVLKPHGTLVFKWAESQFPVADILKLTPVRPLFGHHTGKNTHWCVFMKVGI